LADGSFVVTKLDSPILDKLFVPEAMATMKFTEQLKTFINYQDGTNDKAAAEDHDDQDNYLTDALNRDQNFGSINIIAVHLD
jgi:hypothetical protein